MNRELWLTQKVTMLNSAFGLILAVFFAILGAIALAGFALIIGGIYLIIKKRINIEIPVIYTKQIQEDLRFDGFARKATRDQAQYIKGAMGTKIVSGIEPQEGDIVIEKYYSSAFYGTPLTSFLVGLKVDTLLITGGTTSGCVRTTCIDAISRNYNVGVLVACVYDRIELFMNDFIKFIYFCGCVGSIADII